MRNEIPLRVLVLGRVVTEQNDNLDGAMYDLYVRLSKKIKLIVVANKFQASHYGNFSQIQVSHYSFRFFKRLGMIFAFSVKIIKHRKEYDVVFLRLMANLIPLQ